MASNYGRELGPMSGGLSPESPASDELHRRSKSVQTTVHLMKEEYTHSSDEKIKIVSSSYIHGLAAVQSASLT